jgi:putative endonuclease
MLRWVTQILARARAKLPLGQRAESAAAAHLKRQGYRILGRNIRNRVGEMDILADDPRSGALVVVEVKAMAREYPRPEDHVNFAKRRKLTLLGAGLLRRRRFRNRFVRFDVVAVVWPDGAPQPTRLTHIENAFEATR